MNLINKTDEIVEALNAGATGVLPTDTIYGLVAKASNQKAVLRIYNLKQRTEKPGTIIASSTDQLVSLGVDKASLDRVSDNWPGPVSVILPFDGPQYLHQGKNSLAVRIPRNDLLIEILDQTGPLMTSSANISDEPAANTIEQAFGYFGNKADFYVDGGDLSNQRASTILKITDRGVEVVRK